MTSIEVAFPSLPALSAVDSISVSVGAGYFVESDVKAACVLRSADSNVALSSNAIPRSVFINSQGKLTLQYKPISSVAAGSAVLACSGIITPQTPTVTASSGSLLLADAEAAPITVPRIVSAVLNSLSGVTYKLSNASWAADDVQLTISGPASFALRAGNVVRIAVPVGMSASAQSEDESVCVFSDATTAVWTPNTDNGAEFVEVAVPRDGATLAQIICGPFITALTLEGTGSVTIYADAAQARAQLAPVAVASNIAVPALKAGPLGDRAFIVLDPEHHKVTYFLSRPRTAAEMFEEVHVADLPTFSEATFWSADNSQSRCEFDGKYIDHQNVNELRLENLALAGSLDASNILKITCSMVNFAGVAVPRSRVSLLLINSGNVVKTIPASVNAYRPARMQADVSFSAPYPGATTKLTISIPEITVSVPSSIFNGLPSPSPLDDYTRVIDIETPASYGSLIHSDKGTDDCQIAITEGSTTNYYPAALAAVTTSGALRVNIGTSSDYLAKGARNIKIECEVEVRRTDTPSGRGIINYSGRIVYGIASGRVPMQFSHIAAAGPAALPRVSDSLLSLAPVTAWFTTAQNLVQAGSEVDCTLYVQTDSTLPADMLVVLGDMPKYDGISTVTDYASNRLPEITAGYSASTTCTYHANNLVDTFNGDSIALKIVWFRSWTDKIITIAAAKPIQTTKTAPSLSLTTSIPTGSKVMEPTTLEIRPDVTLYSSSSAAPKNYTLTVDLVEPIIATDSFKCVSVNTESEFVNQLRAYAFAPYNASALTTSATESTNAYGSLVFTLLAADQVLGVPVQCSGLYFTRVVASGAAVLNITTASLVRQSDNVVIVAGVAPKKMCQSYPCSEEYVDNKVLNSQGTITFITLTPHFTASLVRDSFKRLGDIGSIEATYTLPNAAKQPSLVVEAGSQFVLEGQIFRRLFDTKDTVVSINGEVVNGEWSFSSATGSIQRQFTTVATSRKVFSGSVKVSVDNLVMGATQSADNVLNLSLRVSTVKGTSENLDKALSGQAEFSQVGYFLEIPRPSFAVDLTQPDNVNLTLSYIPFDLGFAANNKRDYFRVAFNEALSKFAINSADKTCKRVLADGSLHAKAELTYTVNSGANDPVSRLTAMPSDGYVIPASQTPVTFVCTGMTYTGVDKQFSSYRLTPSLGTSSTSNVAAVAFGQYSLVSRFGTRATGNLAVNSVHVYLNNIGIFYPDEWKSINVNNNYISSVNQNDLKNACLVSSDACPLSIMDPVGIPYAGLERRSVQPANTTAGSDFGALVVTIHPLPLAVPVGGFFRVHLPTSWSVGASLSCSASVTSANAARANIPLTTVTSPYDSPASFAKARSWGAVASESDARWIEVRALAAIPATSADSGNKNNMLRIFCDRVRVSATASYAAWGNTIDIYDDKHRPLQQTPMSIMPAITAHRALTHRLVRAFTLARSIELSAAEFADLKAALAEKLDMDLSRITLLSQKIIYTASTADADSTTETLTPSLRVTVALAATSADSVLDLERIATQAAATLAAAVASSVSAPVLSLAALTSSVTTMGCTDNIKTPDSSETDIDCGGSECDPCLNGSTCSADSDCQSNNCVLGLCASRVNAAAGLAHSAAFGLAAAALLLSVVFGA